MPYAHKYAYAVTDHGMVGAIAHFMPEDGLFKTMVRSGAALVTKDAEGIVKVLIDAEMKMLTGLRTPVIFMQNVFVDLLLGMGFTKAFRMFHDHVREKYRTEPGFITMNLPLLADALAGEGIETPIICSNISKIGFRMCGGQTSIARFWKPAKSAQSQCPSMLRARFPRVRPSNGWPGCRGWNQSYLAHLPAAISAAPAIWSLNIWERCDSYG